MEMSGSAGAAEGTPLPGPVRFVGRVETRRSPGVQCITLVGRTEAGAQIHLLLLGEVPADFPLRLEGAEVERTGDSQYRIRSGTRLWNASGRCYVHADVTAAFYAAVRPRPVPFVKRLFWRLALAVARTRVVQWWLARSSARA